MINFNCVYLDMKKGDQPYCEEKEKEIVSCRNCRLYLSVNEARDSYKKIKNIEVITDEK